MLADGSFEEMKSLFEYYYRALGLSKQRARLLGKHGAFFPETMTQFGTFAGGWFGWAAQDGSVAVNCTGVVSDSGGGRVAWQKSNRYRRFFLSVSLRVSLSLSLTLSTSLCVSFVLQYPPSVTLKGIIGKAAWSSQ